MNPHTATDLQSIYQNRFRDIDYRRAVWAVLVRNFFQSFVRPTDTVLDLGCGYGEFVNQIECGEKYALDLNPDVVRRVEPGVHCLLQDCAARWPLADEHLDLVFTSNFFEHLSDKLTLGQVLDEIHRCLKPGGRLIAMGPNIEYLPGAYWDFWDHHLPLTESSLKEALATRGFNVDICIGRFLPYTMAEGPRYPLVCVWLYLKVPAVWRLFGTQFLVVATKPNA